MKEFNDQIQSLTYHLANIANELAELNHNYRIVNGLYDNITVEDSKNHDDLDAQN